MLFHLQQQNNIAMPCNGTHHKHNLLPFKLVSCKIASYRMKGIIKKAEANSNSLELYCYKAIMKWVDKEKTSRIDAI